jgi:hypothetical protein
MEKHMDLAAIDKLLTTTRSVRKRLDGSRPVPLDVETREKNRPRLIIAATGSTVHRQAA